MRFLQVCEGFPVRPEESKPFSGVRPTGGPGPPTEPPPSLRCPSLPPSLQRTDRGPRDHRNDFRRQVIRVRPGTGTPVPAPGYRLVRRGPGDWTGPPPPPPRSTSSTTTPPTGTGVVPSPDSAPEDPPDPCSVPQSDTEKRTHPPASRTHVPDPFTRPGKRVLGPLRPTLGRTRHFRTVSVT